MDPFVTFFPYFSFFSAYILFSFGLISAFTSPTTQARGCTDVLCCDNAAIRVIMQQFGLMVIIVPLTSIMHF